jgi:hypothetical protein
MGNPEAATPMLDSVERWNWAVRISVVGLFVVALVVIAFILKSVVVPVVLAWVVAMVLLPVVDGFERWGLPRVLTSIVLVILLIASNGDSRGPDRSADLLGRAGGRTWCASRVSLAGSCFSSESAPGPYQYCRPSALSI